MKYTITIRIEYFEWELRMTWDYKLKYQHSDADLFRPSRFFLN